MYEKIVQALIKADWVVYFDDENVMDILGINLKELYTNKLFRETYDKACDDVFDGYKAEVA